MSQMTERVVVAGGAGFIGRHVVTELATKPWKIRVVDKMTSPEGQQDSIAEFVSTDLRDREAARTALADAQVCILLAARSAGIGYFNEHPAEMLDDNLRIISSIFSAAKHNHLRHVVYVSSSCIFDNSPAYPIREEALLTSAPPNTGYPFSKLVGEFYCKAFLEQHGVAFTIIRPFNVYGRGEFPGNKPGDSHVIPDLALKLASGQDPIEIFGDGKQTRSFTYVTDVASGIVSTLNSQAAFNTDFNLGYPTETNILQLAQKMWYLSGRKRPFSFRSVSGYKIDVRQRAVDITKATTLLGWKPRVALDEGLSLYLEWFQKTKPYVRGS